MLGAIWHMDNLYEIDVEYLYTVLVIESWNAYLKDCLKYNER